MYTFTKQAAARVRSLGNAKMPVSNITIAIHIQDIHGGKETCQKTTYTLKREEKNIRNYVNVDLYTSFLYAMDKKL